MRYFTLLLLTLILAGSCQKGIHDDEIGASTVLSSDAVTAEVTREYSISPATTDPAINTFLAAHFVSVKEGATLKNTLFLFIPGTYRSPAESKGILRKAASLGYHAIGL